MRAWNVFRNFITWPFRTWDRAWGTFGILTGIVSTFATFYFLDYPEGFPWFIIARDIGMLFVVLILILVLTFGNARKDMLYRNRERTARRETERQQSIYSDLQRAFASQLARANDMVQRTTQELFHQYRGIFLKRADIIATKEEFEVFREICLSVTTHVRESLIIYFHTLGINLENDISVSVKLILPLKSIRGQYPRQFAKARREGRQQDLKVITVFRDNRTWEANKVIGKREVISALYTIEGNTAFDAIINDPRDRFVENNLRELQRRGHYKNENTNWNLHYNSTLVVPMVLQEAVRVPKEECRYLGFLAVDSLNPGGENLYDSEECYHILNHAALTLSSYFLVLILYHDR